MEYLICHMVTFLRKNGNSGDRLQTWERAEARTAPPGPAPSRCCHAAAAQSPSSLRVSSIGMSGSVATPAQSNFVPTRLSYFRVPRKVDDVFDLDL